MFSTTARFVILLLLFLRVAVGQGSHAPIVWEDETTPIGVAAQVRMAGSGVVCARSGARVTCTIGGGGTTAWGDITGTLSAQTDLQTALDAKAGLGTSNTWTTGAQSFAAATTLTLPIAAGANPTASGVIHYDSTANTLKYGANGVGRTIATRSATETFTGKTIAFGSNTLTNVMSLTTAQSVTAGIKKTFQADATNAGFRLGGVAGDPSSPVNGDMWYDSTANELTARINGANVALGAGGGGSGTVTTGAAGDLAYYTDTTEISPIETGVVTVDGNQRVVFKTGATAGIGFGDNDTAVFEDGDDYLKFAIAGIIRWTFDGVNPDRFYGRTTGSPLLNASPTAGPKNAFSFLNRFDDGISSTGDGSFAFYSNGNSFVEIGGSQTMQVFDQTDTTGDTNLTLKDGAGQTSPEVSFRRNNGTLVGSLEGVGSVWRQNEAGTVLTIQTRRTSIAGPGLSITDSGAAQTFSSSSGGLVQLSSSFAPTSGTGVFSHLELSPTINQTGGANGITRGLYINPTLTAAADFRGIEVADLGASNYALKTGTGIVDVGGGNLQLNGLPVSDTFFRVTRNAGDTAILDIAAGQARVGNTVTTYSAAQVELNAGSATGTIAIFIASDGTLTCEHDGLTLDSISNCTEVDSTASFDDDSFPIALWTTGSAGVWDADSAAFDERSPGRDVTAPGSGLVSSTSNGVKTLTVSANSLSEDATPDGTDWLILQPNAGGANYKTQLNDAIGSGNMNQAVANDTDNTVSVSVGTSGTEFEKTGVTIDPATDNLVTTGTVTAESFIATGGAQWSVPVLSAVTEGGSGLAGFAVDSDDGLLHFFPNGGADTPVPSAASTTTFTNKTYDVEGTGNNFSTVDELWYGAGLNNAGTAATSFHLPASGAPAETAVSGSDSPVSTLASLGFDDTSDETVQATLFIPTGTSSITLMLKWYAAATTGEAQWFARTKCTGDGETLSEVSWNAIQSFAPDTAGGTTLDTNNTNALTLTLTGCAATELMQVQIGRNADASDDDAGVTEDDDMTGDAFLLGGLFTIRRTL